MSEDPDDATPGGRREGDGADPLSDLDADLDRDDGDVPEDAFEEVDVGDVDEDAAWNRLSDDDLEAISGEVVVPKRTYCERCEHFSDPPAVSCEHPGTEIHRLADMEHFRVENCPVVAERRRMGGEPEDE